MNNYYIIANSILHVGSFSSLFHLRLYIIIGLLTAVAWPAALISAATMIDNPWSVCTQRATAAGKQLAEVLLAREQVGNSGVTATGISTPGPRAGRQQWG